MREREGERERERDTERERETERFFQNSQQFAWVQALERHLGHRQSAGLAGQIEARRPRRWNMVMYQYKQVDEKSIYGRCTRKTFSDIYLRASVSRETKAVRKCENPCAPQNGLQPGGPAWTK